MLKNVQKYLNNLLVFPFWCPENIRKPKGFWCFHGDQRGNTAIFLKYVWPFLGGAPTSICHFFRLSVRPSVRRAPYLRNRTSSGYMEFFCILIFWLLERGVGVKGQKKPKMKNNDYIRHAPYLRNSVAYDHDFWYTCVKWWYLQAFFHFSKKFSIFFHFFLIGLLGGSRGRK